jgi:hypothetical protein
MKEVFEWKSRGKGAFAFQDGVKVLQGSTCALLRNELNTIGEINGLLKIVPSMMYASLDLTQTLLLADKNCIQLRAPLFGSDVEGASFVPGQHFGHLAKDCAKAIAELMDKGFHFRSPHLADNSSYGTTGSYFTAVLTYCDSNRSKLGYDLDVIVHTDDSTLWWNTLLVFLRGKGLKPVLIA